MERTVGKGDGMNGVASGRLLRVGWAAGGLFIPCRRWAIISLASWIRLFFFFIAKLLL
jgi:hypothetical protein